VVMDKETRNFLIDVTRPIYITVRFFFRLVNKILFGWLDILLQQRRQDASLRYDVIRDLYFLFPAGSVVKEPREIYGLSVVIAALDST
jgi:hypothetical protein